ncbi:hypothetical protein T12_17004 [Trichinella patagoniensis]|uniref:Uncharacterized protein n=1 Tax=Trichinella patagoniensis TaxID=990121 RepID=A0A0V0Z935_9BILA|nr:hypothetical protein T12_17004 [Trichinella patagoniensis]
MGPTGCNNLRVNGHCWPHEWIRGTDPVRRTTVVLNTTMPAQGLQLVIDPTRYSRMEKLLRVTTCCLRWVDQLRKP